VNEQENARLKDRGSRLVFSDLGTSEFFRVGIADGYDFWCLKTQCIVTIRERLLRVQVQAVICRGSETTKELPLKHCGRLFPVIVLRRE